MFCGRGYKFPYQRKSSNQSLNHEIQIHRKPSCIYFRLHCFTFVSNNILWDLEIKKILILCICHYLHCLFSFHCPNSLMRDSFFFPAFCQHLIKHQFIGGANGCICSLITYFNSVITCFKNIPPLFFK